MKLTKRQSKLLDFVKEQHKGQVRKYTGNPYWEHCYDVGMIANVSSDHGLNMEIGFCHDLFEDTNCTSPMLLNFLTDNGYNPKEADKIVFGTLDLTDVYTKENFPQLNRKSRKIHEAHRLGGIPLDSQTVKYADLISNTSSIVECDPKFAETYIREKHMILDKMRRGDINLLIKCCFNVKTVMDKLNIIINK